MGSRAIKDVPELGQEVYDLCERGKGGTEDKGRGIPFLVNLYLLKVAGALRDDRVLTHLDLVTSSVSEDCEVSEKTD